jgi:hypothetical protein
MTTSEVVTCVVHMHRKVPDPAYGAHSFSPPRSVSGWRREPASLRS